MQQINFALIPSLHGQIHLSLGKWLVGTTTECMIESATSRKPETIKLLSGPQFEMHKYWKWITVTIHFMATIRTVAVLCICVSCLAHPSALNSSGFVNGAHNLQETKEIRTRGSFEFKIMH